jgi:hypothetical protein
MEVPVPRGEKKKVLMEGHRRSSMPGEFRVENSSYLMTKKSMKVYFQRILQRGGVTEMRRLVPV